MAYLDGKLALGELDLALLGLLEDSGGILLGQTAADGAGLLGSEVEGHVLLVLVEQAKLSPLLGVDDGQDAGDRLAEVVATSINVRQPLLSLSLSLSLCRCSSSCPHVWAIRGYCGGEAVGRRSTYILVSLVPEETIFWMRSWPSSVLSSPSCLVRSSLDLVHNWPALTFPEDCATHV